MARTREVVVKVRVTVDLDEIAEGLYACGATDLVVEDLMGDVVDEYAADDLATWLHNANYRPDTIKKATVL